MVIHHAKIKDIEILEEIFARFTESGWVIPQWLVLMRQTAK